MAKDFTRRGLFLMDESMVDYLEEVYHHFDFNESTWADPMPLIMAISDYCTYGEVRTSLQDDERVKKFLAIISDRLDLYIQTLREKGLAPATFKEWGE